MKKCKNCNAIIRDDDQYCRNCGILIQSKFYTILCNLFTILMTIFFQIFVTSGKRIKNKECSINKTY